MGAFPNLSRNVPFCHRLSSFVPICPCSGPQGGQKRTNGDKTGHFGTNWETPPFSIYPHLALLTLTLPSLLFWQKSEDPPKKARICLSAEPLKSLEKRAKTHKKARKTAKRKKREENEKSEDSRVRVILVFADSNRAI